MLVRNRPLEGRIARLSSIGAACIVAVGVVWLVGVRGADTAKTEQWGPREDNVRTRLVPLADHFTLGQPMRFRLELKNVGQTVVHYDPQQVDINGSVAVSDPQGRSIRYMATSFQTMGSKRPSLTPGNVVVLFEGLDVDSQYLIVKPGKYSMQFRGYGAPKSNTVEIEVRPGTLPPIKRIAARLLDVLPGSWVITVHGFAGESDRSRAVYWDEPPPGWEPVRGMPTIELAGSRAKEEEANASFWLSDRELKWTGRVAAPGQTAAVYYGKCDEGYIYAVLPSAATAAAAKWPAFEKDLAKALQAEKEAPSPRIDSVMNDDALNRLEANGHLDSLILDNTATGDAELKRLEGRTQLTALWLRRTRVTDRGLQSLAKMPLLRNVWFDGDNITDAGLENLKGLAQLRGLSLEATKITDAGLAKLKGLAQLEYLSLDETAITDAGLDTVKGFTRLRSLSLDGTRITDAGLKRIKALTTIQRLSLANTQITDAGLEHLRGFSKLTSLDIDETKVTDEGVKRLQQVLPRCELFYRSAEESRRRWQAQMESTREEWRRTSSLYRVQSISGSSLKKHFVVQFDKPGLKRQPLLVIVWKADAISISQGGLETDAPTVAVNEHLLTPSRAEKAVYSLQPDYSLKRIPLTEAEISRLFSHIVRSEERAVSSDELTKLPADAYWEEKVGPHLKVVEPEQKKKRS